MPKLLSTLPAGTKVKDVNSKFLNAPVVFRVLGHDHDGAGTTSLIAEKILALRCFDAKEPSNSNSDRKSYGNNRYRDSNILQWLNSAAGPGQWYTKKHTADQSPDSMTYTNYNPYTQKAGFLNEFTEDFIEALVEVSKVTALNTVTDGGGSEVVASKIFLLSNTEVGLANENSIVEGSLYSMFSDNESRKAYPTAECVSDSDYTNDGFATNKSWYWWLRSPGAGYSRAARYVNTGGTLSGNSACDGHYGVRPACALPSSIMVSDAPDSDGAYIITWNVAPVIEGDGDLGLRHKPFNYSFTVTDEENDTTTAKAVLTGDDIEDIELLEETEVDLGEENIIPITQDIINSLTDESLYTIAITAEDAQGAVTIKTASFRKTSNVLQVRTDTIETDEAAASILATVQYDAGDGAVLIEAANDAASASPTWEDITEAVGRRRIHNFQNQPEDGFGVAVRVTITKGDDARVYINALGFSFR